MVNVRYLFITGLGNNLVASFYFHSNLQEMYLQNYIGTYHIEKAAYNSDNRCNTPSKRRSYSSQYTNVVDTNLNSMVNLFGKHKYKILQPHALSDGGTSSYRYVEQQLSEEYQLDSVLYERPYEPCNCGFYGKVRIVNILNITTNVIMCNTGLIFC